MSSNPALNISVESLKHLDQEERDEVVSDLLENNLPTALVSKQASFVSPSPLKTKNHSIIFQHGHEGERSQVSQHSSFSGSQTNIFLRSMSEIAMPPSTVFQIKDQTNPGAVFLRNMFTGPAPIRNYLNFLKKDSVDLTDPCDSAIVMQILHKQNKTKKECDFLLKSIQGMHLFQKNKEMLAMKDCNQHLFENLKVHYYPPKKTVFNYGEFGYTYYIVLSGAADLLIPSPNYEQHEKTESTVPDSQRERKQTEVIPTKSDTRRESAALIATTTTRRDSSATTTSVASAQTNAAVTNEKKNKAPLSKWNVLKKSFVPDQEILSHHLPQDHYESSIEEKQDESQEDYLKRAFPQMNYIKTFKAGEAFGEIALMTKQRRTGSIVCREDTYLMSLTKESFDVILGSYHENIIQRKLNFLKSYEFFRNMPNSKLLALLHFMKIVNYKNKNIVYTEGDPSRFLYFIREGEVQISQLCSMEDSNASSKQNSIKSRTQALGSDHHPEISAMRAKKDIRSKNKRIAIVIKGKNAYFGEDEILKSVDTRQQQAICSSEEAEIFLLKKDILYNYTRGFSVVEKLKEEFKVKAEWNQQRKDNIALTRKSTLLDFHNFLNSIEAEKQSSSHNQPNSLSPLPSAKLPHSLTSTTSGQFANFTKTPEQQQSTTASNSISNQGTSNKQQHRPSFRQTFSVLPHSNSQSNPNKNIPMTFSDCEIKITTPFTHSSRIQSTYSDEQDQSNIFLPRLQTETNSVKQKISLQLNQLPPNLRSHSSSKIASLTPPISHNNSIFQYPSQQQSGEELIQEQHMMDYLNKKYFAANNKKSNEQLQREAKENFGDISHSSFVNQIERTIESKMEILKKLNRNGSQQTISLGNSMKELQSETSNQKKRNSSKKPPLGSKATSPADHPLNFVGQSSPSTPSSQLLSRKLFNQHKQQSLSSNSKPKVTCSISPSALQSLYHLQQNKHRRTLTSSSSSQTSSKPNISTIHSNTNINGNQTNNNNNNNNNNTSCFSQTSIEDTLSCESSRSSKRLNFFSTTATTTTTTTTNNSANNFTVVSMNNNNNNIVDLDVLEEVSENNSPVKLSETKRFLRSKKSFNRLNQMIQMSQSSQKNDQSIPTQTVTQFNVAASSKSNDHSRSSSNLTTMKATSFVQDSFTISTPTSLLSSRAFNINQNNISNRTVSQNKKGNSEIKQQLTRNYSSNQINSIGTNTGFTVIPPTLAAKENIFKARQQSNQHLQNNTFFAMPSRLPQNTSRNPQNHPEISG